MQRDLIQFVENIKNKNFDTMNERQIETSIVIPLLESLGWDTTIEDEVKVQSGIGKGRSDIELRSKELCKVVIDAKKGKANLVNLEFERQLMSYAGSVNNGEPSDIAILTNGKNWQFYLPSIGGGHNKKRFYTIDISKESSNDITSIFNELLSKNFIINGNSLNRALSINEQRLRSEVIKHEKEIKEIKEIGPIKITKECPQNYLPVDSDFTKKYIESYYFNGSIYNTDSWKGLLVGILENVYTLYKKDFERILGVTGGYGRIYFSKDPDEVNFPLEIKDTGIYVDTKLSANNIARLCSDIIYEFGHSEDDLKIKISSENIKETISQPITITAKPIGTDAINLQESKMVAQPVYTSADTIVSEKNKRERYGEYMSAVQKILPDIKKMISSAKGKEIKFKVIDIAKDLGNDFIGKSPTTIYWGLKYVLFREGIVVGLTTYSGEKLLTMRDATPDDKLPASLAKMSYEKQTISIDIDYNAAIQNILPEIKDTIAKEEEFEIYTKDLIKKLGIDFENKNPRVIYWGIKYLLFTEGITVWTDGDIASFRMLKDFLNLPSRMGKDFKPFEDDLETDWKYYPPKYDYTGKKLISLDFIGSSYEVGTWIGLLEKLIEIIHEKHKDEFHKILNLRYNEEKYFISRYFSTDQKELNKPRKVAEVDNKDVYIETKLPANKIVGACYYLIHEFGYSDDDLKIKTN